MFLSWFFKQGCYDPSAIGPADIDEYVRAYAGVGALRAGFAFNRSRDQSAAQVKAVAKGKMTTPLLYLGGEVSMGDVLAEVGQATYSEGGYHPALMRASLHKLRSDSEPSECGSEASL